MLVIEIAAGIVLGFVLLAYSRPLIFLLAYLIKYALIYGPLLVGYATWPIQNNIMHAVFVIYIACLVVYWIKDTNFDTGKKSVSQ